jgi:ABC-type dipeptide/oligopeptide/nickel transport system permease component
MKPNHEPESEASLNRVLQGWVVDAPLPPRFQEQVWNRISRAEAHPTLATLLRSMLGWFQVSFTRPKLAVSYVVILLVLGIAAGSWAAQKQNSRLDESLGSRYLQSVNPFQTSSPD